MANPHDVPHADDIDRGVEVSTGLHEHLTGRRGPVIAAVGIAALAGAMAMAAPHSATGGPERVMIIDGAGNRPSPDLAPGTQPPSLDVADVSDQRLTLAEYAAVSTCIAWEDMRDDAVIIDTKRAVFSFAATPLSAEHLGLMASSLLVLQDETQVSASSREQIDYWCSGIYTTGM
jgi:hypothetical protein